MPPVTLFGSKGPPSTPVTQARRPEAWLVSGGREGTGVAQKGRSNYEPAFCVGRAVTEAASTHHRRFLLAGPTKASADQSTQYGRCPQHLSLRLPQIGIYQGPNPASGGSDRPSIVHFNQPRPDPAYPSADETPLVMNITSMLLRTLARTRFNVMMARKLATNASVAARPTPAAPGRQ